MKIYANIQTRQRPANSQGKLEFMVEYVFLEGLPKSGKLSVTIDVESENEVNRRLKLALSAALSVPFRDIVGPSV